MDTATLSGGPLTVDPSQSAAMLLVYSAEGSPAVAMSYFARISGSTGYELLERMAGLARDRFLVQRPVILVQPRWIQGNDAIPGPGRALVLNERVDLLRMQRGDGLLAGCE